MWFGGYYFDLNTGMQNYVGGKIAGNNYIFPLLIRENIPTKINGFPVLGMCFHTNIKFYAKIIDKEHKNCLDAILLGCPSLPGKIIDKELGKIIINPLYVSEDLFNTLRRKNYIINTASDGSSRINPFQVCMIQVKIHLFLPQSFYRI